MSKIVRLSILGAGTVGGGVLTLLRENADLLQAQTGKRFEVRHVLVRDLNKPRAVPTPPKLLTTDPQRAVCDPKVHVVLELMGGLEPARTLIRDALQAGKHVITANKWVMAVSGDELLRLARQRGVRLLYEASVAGSLPILNALQGSLAGNRIQRIIGIVNSTTNFILREMERAVEAGEPAETAYANALRKSARERLRRGRPHQRCGGLRCAIQDRHPRAAGVPAVCTVGERLPRGDYAPKRARFALGATARNGAETAEHLRAAARRQAVRTGASDADSARVPALCGAWGVQRYLAAGQRLSGDVVSRLWGRARGRPPARCWAT
jgi:hypothetical protein